MIRLAVLLSFWLARRSNHKRDERLAEEKAVAYVSDYQNSLEATRLQGYD
jgi:hypothetical protein